MGLQKYLQKEGQIEETEIGLIRRSEQLLQSSTFPYEKILRRYLEHGELVPMRTAWMSRASVLHIGYREAAKNIISLDAAILALFHGGHHGRGASEFFRYAS